jgi:cyanophycin synthetase
MRIDSTNVYVGPNLFARFPVIRHVLDLGELENWPTVRLGEDFIGQLLERLPGLEEHGCSYREPGGFVRRMREGEGTWLGHVMEHVAIELQVVAGSDVTFGRTRSIEGRPGFYNMVFQYKDADVGRQASPVRTGISPSGGISSFATHSDVSSGRARPRSSGPPKSAIFHGCG